ncbi:hypothetical protein HDU86_003788 [Geranomyces michiganensis]|nr:hypothetical protein HDU86_003788 [Geranomyces michiganensis]
MVYLAMSNDRTLHKSKRQRTTTAKDSLDDSARAGVALFSADVPTVLLQDAQDRKAARPEQATRLLTSTAVPLDLDPTLEGLTTQLVESLEIVTAAIFRFMNDQPADLALENRELFGDMIDTGMQMQLQNVYQGVVRASRWDYGRRNGPDRRPEYPTDAVQTHCNKIVHDQLHRLAAEHDIQKRKESYTEWAWDAYKCAVGDLAGLLERYEAGSTAFGFGEICGFFEGTLRNALSPSWMELMQTYFDESFSRCLGIADAEDNITCDSADAMAEAQLVAEQLVKIGMRGELCAALITIARKRVRKRIEAVKTEYHVRTLADVLHYVDDYVRDGWLAETLNAAQKRWKGDGPGILGYNWEHVLRMSALQDFCAMRVSELFSMIQEAEVQVPEAALSDLKECLKTSVQKEELVKTLRTE